MPAVALHVDDASAAFVSTALAPTYRLVQPPLLIVIVPWFVSGRSRIG